MVSVMNLLEYANIRNYYNKNNRQPSSNALSTIKLYRQKIQLLSEPNLYHLLIKGDQLNQTLFGPHRPILEYMPAYIYFSSKGDHTYATLETTGNPIRINGYAGHWQTPDKPNFVNQKFLEKNNYKESDRKLLSKLTLQGLNEFYGRMTALPHLEPEYKEMMEYIIIQVKLEENKFQKKMGTARGLCSRY